MLSLLLSPAVKLMNRLNYLYKFVLINVLFLVPILWLAYLQLSEIGTQQRATEVQLEGVAVLRDALALTLMADDIRDLGVVSSAASDIEPQIRRLQADFIARLELLETKVSGLDQDGRMGQVIEQLRALAQRNPGSSGGDLDAIFMIKNKLVLESWSLVRVLSYQTGLYQDRNPHNFLLMKVVLDAMESVLEHQGQRRSFSTTAVRAGRINSTLMEVLNRVMDQLINDQKRLGDILQPVLAARKVYGEGVVSAVETAMTQLDQDAQRFESELLIDESLDHDWQQYFAQQTRASQQIHQFMDASLGYVEQQFQLRHEAQGRRYFLLLAAVVAVFFITNYLLLGLSSSVRHSISAILAAAEAVAKGDMTGRVKIDSRDEMGSLASHFNQMIDQMRSLLTQVTNTVSSVAEQAEVVDGIAQRGSLSVESQRRETDQVATAINQMVGSAQEVANKTQVASQESSDVDQQTVQGRQLVSAMLVDIEQLSQDIDHSMVTIRTLVKESDNITRVLDVIKGVAEQTNLLALNAAIEAARAGEQGRGFAVVADEVRTLAQRTQASTSEIESMITQLQSGVGAAVRAMEVSHDKVGHAVANSSEVGRTLEHIAEAVSRIVEFNAQIASAGEEQTMVASEIERNISSISQAGSQTAEGAKSTVDACQQMARQTERLKAVVSNFKV
ncbi:methyl-accepting chemotaxis protein [Marinobacterium maritimum]|uniref:Methyl-accepting chemotaxis protein n=1 Tax=Marinobacterium maritimum TaxID=500162 RepID=A0ABP3T8V6_9GAMM